MQDRHLDRQRYWNEQAYTTEHHVIPFVSPFLSIEPGVRVLEVGCGEGGNLKPFLDQGCECVGVDLNERQIGRAKEFFAEHPAAAQITFMAQDIYEVSTDDWEPFDLIIMRDVIEHIIDQQRFMGYIKQFLKPEGRFFIGFPPWQMPFGGHQQVCHSKLLSKLPYFHLLPRPVYRGILQLFGETKGAIRELMGIADTGISIERLRQVIRSNDYEIEHEQLWLINPNYKVKFGLKPRKQSPLIGQIPYLRNFLTTCGYYVLRKA